MKILGIAGSPRKGGNTDTLLGEAMKGAGDSGAETEVICLRDRKISPCLGCHECDKEGRCILKDDMQEIYGKLVQADHIIFASPICFYSVSSYAKLMIDRCQCLWVKRYVLKEPAVDRGFERRGSFISVGATKGQNLFEGAKLTVKYFFDAVGIKYHSDLLIRRVDKKGEVKKHPEYIKQSYELGKSIIGG